MAKPDGAKTKAAQAETMEWSFSQSEKYIGIKPITT
jgi:hypothetical protein